MGIEFNPHVSNKNKTETQNNNNVSEKQKVKTNIINLSEVSAGEEITFKDPLRKKDIKGKIEIFENRPYLVEHQEGKYKKADGSYVVLLTKIYYDLSEGEDSPRFDGIRNFLLGEDGEYREINPRKNVLTPLGI